jgi:hypothetical protein
MGINEFFAERLSEPINKLRSTTTARCAPRPRCRPKPWQWLGAERTVRRSPTGQEKAFLAFHRNRLFGKMKPTITRKRRRASQAIATETSDD